jgi:hypothetical protein
VKLKPPGSCPASRASGAGGLPRPLRIPARFLHETKDVDAARRAYERAHDDVGGVKIQSCARSPDHQHGEHHDAAFGSPDGFDRKAAQCMKWKRFRQIRERFWSARSFQASKERLLRFRGRVETPEHASAKMAGTSLDPLRTVLRFGVDAFICSRLQTSSALRGKLFTARK